MAERAPSGGRAVGREHERAPSRRRRRAAPGLDPPLANGADQRAAGLGETAPYNNVAADLPKPKKKAKKKKKGQTPLHGLEESPGRYAPGPAVPTGPARRPPLRELRRS